MIANDMNMGFEVRYSKAEVTLFGLDGGAGGLHLGLLLGAPL